MANLGSGIDDGQRWHHTTASAATGGVSWIPRRWPAGRL